MQISQMLILMTNPALSAFIGGEEKEGRRCGDEIAEDCVRRRAEGELPIALLYSIPSNSTSEISLFVLSSEK